MIVHAANVIDYRWNMNVLYKRMSLRNNIWLIMDKFSKDSVHKEIILFCDNKKYSGKIRGDTFRLAQDFCKRMNYNSIHKITKTDKFR